MFYSHTYKQHMNYLQRDLYNFASWTTLRPPDYLAETSPYVAL